MIKYFTYIALILSLTIGIVHAQDIRINSQLDTNLIKIGEQAKWSVEIQYPKDIEVTFPILQDTIVKEIEILDLSFDTIITQKDINHLIANYTITSFDSGYYSIPPQIIINMATGDTTQSNPLMLAVATYTIDSTNQNQIFDIKAPLDAPWTFREFLKENYPYLLLGLLLIAILFAVLWFIRKRKAKEVVQVKKIIPKEAAHVVALRNLDSLKEKKLWQKDRTKLYYIELSDIVRSYLENRFRVMALEQTSQEIIETLSNGQIVESNQLMQLKQILSTADMAKFAKAKPLAHENDLALNNAYQLVQETKLIEQKEQKSEQEIDETSKIEEEKDA